MRIAVYAANSTVRDNIDTALTTILGSFDGWVNPSGTVYYKTFPVTRDELDELRYEFGTLLAVSGFKFSILETNATLKSQIDEFVTAAASETNFFVDLSTHDTHMVAHCNRISGRSGLSATRQAQKMAWNALHKFGEDYKADQVYSGAREIVELDPTNLPSLAGTGTEDILYENKEFVWSSTPASVLTSWPASDLRSLKFKNCKFTADFRIDGENIGMYIEEGCESTGSYPFLLKVGMVRIDSVYTRGNNTNPTATDGDYNYAARITNEFGDLHRTRITNNSGLAAYPAGSTANYSLDGSEEINTATFTSLDDALSYSYEFDLARLAGQRGGITLRNFDAEAFNISFVFLYYTENSLFLNCTMGTTEVGSTDIGGNAEWAFDHLVKGGTYKQPTRSVPPPIGVGSLHRMENVLILDVDCSDAHISYTPNGEPMQDIYIQGGSSKEVNIGTGIGSKGAYVDSWITLNVDDHATGKLKFFNRDSTTRHLDPVIVADSITATQYTTPQRSLFEATYADFTLTNSSGTYTSLSVGLFNAIKGNIYYTGITDNGESLADNPEP